MDYFLKIWKGDVNIWIFLPICLKWYVAEKKIKWPLKKFCLTAIASQSVEWLFLQENKNSNFHNFLPDLNNNPDIALKVV